MSNKSNFIKKIIELLSEKNSIEKEIIADEIIYVFSKAKNKECYTEELKTESIAKLRYCIKDFLLHDNVLTRESLTILVHSECVFIED
ncbi:hypothetical protein ACM55H_17785 [Flavobacterium sp. ZT3R17]|uniref:hypothetical protein n=1 Tax=Flavobacterium cryoconiti TaxID=3398736 RepID=UPI003A847032